ncbi:MAG: hypothetical protein KA586_05205 [Candidatus Promineofilum sp.]|nr:hypothetical protein [Promineifilum sp.]
MGDLINFIFDQFLELFFFPLLGSEPYLRGFFFGVLSAVAAALSWRFASFHRGRILYFFATVQPSLRPSPSGFERMRGCSLSVVLLAIFLGIIISSGCGIIYALSH